MMQNSTIYLVSTIIFVAVVITVYIIYRLKASPNKSSKYSQSIKDKYESKISDLDNELKRQNYIISDYQKKYLHAEANTASTSEVIQDTTKSDLSNNEDSESKVEDLMYEKRNLEREKNQFQDKTKKLWEQSLAIHKEKERIDGMRLEIEKNHKHVTDSINYAKQIQTALLPPDNVLKELMPDHFVLFKPCNVVSGDFYWVSEKNDLLYVVAADCTGHGVPGAFMSMLGISFLNEIVNQQSEPNAANVLEELRDKVIAALHQDQNRSKDGMDIALSIIDKQKKEIQFAGAYNPLILVRNGELTEYKGTRAPIGTYFKPVPFVNNKISYETGDCIFMYSDGYADQFGGEKSYKFGTRTLRNLLLEQVSINLPMIDIKENLDHIFHQWKGEEQTQIDDVLVFGMRM